jgi:hypothetical protein
MIRLKYVLALFVLVFSVNTLTAAENFQWPQPPSQDQGLPYTRTAQQYALEKIGGHIGVFAGSRYAWVMGHRVRLDDDELLACEAFSRKGVIYVPESFACIAAMKSFKFDHAPEYLKSRWVYTIKRKENITSEKVRSITVGQMKYIAFADVAAAEGLKVYQNKRGLLLVGKDEITFSRSEKVLLDTVITMFDTPEKYADPEIATEYIPLLKRQGKWTEHVKVSSKELKTLEGPEPDWPVTPVSEYRFEGFDGTALGSEVPAPGVYPRILFSEEDLPAIRKRIQENKIAQKGMIETEVLLNRSWLDPKTDDGKVFQKLSSGDTEGLNWEPWQGGRRIPRFPGSFDGYSHGIYSSHIEYNSQCLVSIALYALIKDDEQLGRKTAAAIANLYRLQEPNLDRYLKFSDSELGSNPGDANGSTTQWRGMHSAVAHMDLPFALDFAGKWMTPDQKRDMQRFIAKATYGRRTGGGDGPRRAWRDINHVTWHLTHLLALMAIEGCEGFDREAYASGAELTGDFLQWGLNEYGTMFESNGKSGAGLIFQILSMNALARRGINHWGHPHWRNLMKSQVLNTSPNGETTVSSGTWSGGPLAIPAVMMYHTFYPQDRYAEFALSAEFGPSVTTTGFGDFDPAKFDLERYRRDLVENPGRTRLPGPNYPAFTSTVIYDTDWNKTSRADLDAPLDFIDDDQGIVSSYSENSADAVWMNMMVRSNHYLGAGHHHADAGMFHFSSDGVNWITESPFQKIYDGKYHNQVLIDGISQPDGLQGRADWLGASVNPNTVLASADITNSYTWRWANQFILFDTDDWGPRPDQFQWSLVDDPLAINAFKGTQRYKMRPWWPTGIFSNWFPVLRYEYNPVEYAYRTAGLVRGEHPYGIIVDDIKKDDDIHLYQFSSMPGPGVWAARPPQELPDNMLLLAKKGQDRVHAGSARLRPANGEPMLLICLLGGEGTPAGFETGPTKASKFALDAYKALAEEDRGPVSAPIRIETRGDGPHWTSSDNVQVFYDVIIGGCYSKEAHFRTLFIPLRCGENIPDVSYDSDADTATLKWDNQVDTLRFEKSKSEKTLISITRNGKNIYSGKLCN